MNTANYLKNRTPSQALLRKTSFEIWYDRKPDLSHLRTFGCIAYAHIPDAQRKKLDDKSDVTLDEERFTFPRRKHDDAEDDIVTITSNDEVTLRAELREDVRQTAEPEAEAVREKTQTNVTMRTRPTRKCKQTKHYGIDEIYMAEMQTVQSAFSAQLVAEPVSMKQALESDDGNRWRAAAEEEFNSLKEHETWELFELPEGRKVVGRKWVFKVKYAEDGSVDRFKCRLVAQQKQYLKNLLERFKLFT